MLCLTVFVLFWDITTAGRIKTLDGSRGETSWGSTREVRELNTVSHGRTDVTFVYTVPPHEAKDFVQRWLELEEATRKEEGCDVFDLKKQLTDNMVYIAYGSWSGPEDFSKHESSQHVSDFRQYVADRGILQSEEPLLCASCHSFQKGHAEARHDYIHILVIYYVPEAQAEEFLAAWEKVADEVKSEKGIRNYTLHKRKLDNVQYWGYGTWETLVDFQQHFMKYSGRYVDEHDILWRGTFLKKLGNQPE